MPTIKTAHPQLVEVVQRETILNEIREAKKSAERKNLYIGDNHHSETIDEWIGFLLSSEKAWREETERLKVALYTHESYDRTVCELHDENKQLRKRLDSIHHKLTRLEPLDLNELQALSQLEIGE